MHKNVCFKKKIYWALALLTTFVLGFGLSFFLYSSKPRKDERIERLIFLENSKSLVLNMQILEALQKDPGKAKRIVERDFFSNLMTLSKLKNENEIKINKKRLLHLYNNIDRKTLSDDMENVEPGSSVLFEKICNDIETLLKNE